MADKTTWIAIFPRFTTLYGDHTFRTDPVRAVKDFEFRGEVYRSVIDSDASVTISIEESNDGENWDVVFTGDPGDDARQTVYAALTKSMIRGVVELSTTGSVTPTVTLWLVGMLVKRRS